MADPTPEKDTRTAQQLIRQWEKLQAVKRAMVRTGELNGDATANDVIDALRACIPPDLFA